MSSQGSALWRQPGRQRQLPSGTQVGGLQRRHYRHLGPENRVPNIGQPLPLKPSAEAAGMRHGGHLSPAPDSSNRWSLSVAMETPSPASCLGKKKLGEAAVTLRPLQPEQPSEVGLQGGSRPGFQGEPRPRAPRAP